MTAPADIEAQTSAAATSEDLALQEARTPSSQSATFGPDEPLELDAGSTLSPFTIAYETYGTLNEDRSNAILVCHALTGDQYAASPSPVTGKPGWWTTVIGPGKPIDTDRYFVICSNVLGGCSGSTGPASINPETGNAYGLELPVITIRDMVRAQTMLIDRLGIDKLFSVIGGSMGGMQAIQWTSEYPERCASAVFIATAPHHTSQNIAFYEVGRQAVMADPEWHGGRYLDFGTTPRKGLSVARMAAHVTYMSEQSLQSKFGRNLQNREAKTFSFDADFQIESYLRHQGMTFVDRFDPNSYLYVTRAMDYFDIAADHGGQLAKAFTETTPRICLVSFTSDWHYPTSGSRLLVHALNAAGASVSFVEIESDKGHDAFLLEEPEFFDAINGFLNSAAREHKLDPAKPATAPNDSDEAPE
ncbi:homoserine O-acetyltransferase [Cohaesibacter sp. ES.047]|uniref:homoserine O-acetyltransferase MetX n=1 Tax=Cohaesibacter sp. ES.047 TaxID=1798205 RepID=UPI000BB8C9A9|nr:homoserine O-acetyltransferase [Cohaesibacter sp. ES.047]SNY90796.1 homoserine O-acetyltransferase [Cohaesibacter sp. ES.047]